MSFEYMLMHRCPLKDEHGPDKLLQLRKMANMAAVILNEARSENPDVDPSQINISHETTGRLGRKKKAMTLQDLLPAVELMNQVASACEGCPANLSKAFHGQNEGVGCYSSINYPFTAWGDTFLDWVVRYLVQNYTPSPPYPFLFMQGIMDFNTKGAELTQTRQAGNTFFENSQTRHYQCTSFEGKFVPFTLDTVWETLLDLPQDPTVYQAIYQPFFDLIEQLMPQAPPEVKTGFESDITTRQLRQFGYAIRLAGQNGVPVGCMP